MPRLGICGRHLSLKIAAPAKSSPHHGKFSKVRYFHTAFNLPYIYDFITKLCRQQAEVTRNHENEYVRSIGEAEATHKKCKRLKLGGGQAYDRLSD
jgi:hypothetical protein